MVKRTLIYLVITISIFCSSLFPFTEVISATDATININPSISFQRITGWEATAQAGQMECPSFESYNYSLFDRAVDDLGINRLRVPIRSGTENPVDYFSQWQTGQITRTEWKSHWYEIINDDQYPNSINQVGFFFSELDNTIDNVVLP